MNITCGIATKNRPGPLALCLLSVALQTKSPSHIIVVDDSDRPEDPRNVPAYQHVFTLLNWKGITFQWIYGRRKGQHFSHALIQEKAETEWIWRIDDDEIAEPDVLEKLACWTSHGQVGAVAGLVPQGALMPEPSISKDYSIPASGKISDLFAPNLQWFSHPAREMPFEVEHLHSSFLYRKGIARFELALSPVAHREETIFTHEIFRAGYKLLVDPAAVTWHVRAEGGIRSNPQPEWFDNDEKIFQTRMKEWGVDCEPEKVCVLDAGLGDHVVFKTLIPELKKKFGNLLIASAFPDILADDGVRLISIAEAYQRFGCLDRFSIYRWAIEHNWKGSLRDAYRGLLGLDDTTSGWTGPTG